MPDQPGPSTQVRAEWSLLAFTHAVDPSALAGIDATYAFVIDGETALLRIRAGNASVLSADERHEIDATIRMGATTVKAVGSGRLSVVDTLMNGAITVEGDETAVHALARAFDTTSEADRLLRSTAPQPHADEHSLGIHRADGQL